ncbi:hypothetical protein ACFLSZ_04530 [Candidatus Bipolaricaulota bacterium]
MKRRTKWILGLSIGIPVLLVGVLTLMLWLSSPNPETALTSIEVRDLPDVWTQEPSPVDVADDQDTEETVEDVVVHPALGTMGLPISGSLVLIGDGKPFGEEAFELSLDGEDVMLRSNGKFWFKALIATITLKYDQVLQLDSYLRPVMLSSAFDAPLGFGRNMQAEFNGGEATVRSGDDVTVFPVTVDRAFVLGTFSTYAIIPLLYELRELEGEVAFETLVFGGPPNREDEDASNGLPEMTIERIEDGVIRFDDQLLPVSQYAITGDMGTMVLYARGIELLGLYAGDDEESMFVYRADYFEDGFQIVEDDSSE